MGLCSGSDDCPVLESTQRVKWGHAKKFTSEIIFINNCIHALALSLKHNENIHCTYSPEQCITA